MSRSSNFQKILKGVSSQMLVTLLLGLLEIVSFSIMSRLLTKADFGYYAAISAIVVVFASFAETGIGSAIIQRKELTQRYVNNAFTLSLIFGLIISLLLFSLSGILAEIVANESMTVPLRLMSVTLLLNCLVSVFVSLMQRRLEFLRIGMIKLFSLIITTVIAVFLAYNGNGYYAIIIKAILQSALTFILFLYFCKTTFGLAIDKGNTSSIFRFSGWLMASVLFRNLSHQIDKLLMPQLLSVESLGAYNRPKDFIEHISSRLNGIFDMALFPVLSSLQDENEKLARAFRQSLSILNTFAMLLALVFLFNTQLIIRIFFGEQWMSLYTVSVVLSFLPVFNIDGRLSDCYLRSLGMTKQQFFFRIFEALFNIVGVLIGFRWGIIGVALSVVLTNSIAKLLKIIYVANRVQISPIETIIIILRSWRFAVVIIPICIMVQVMLPNCLIYNIVNVFVFVIIAFSLFFIFPHFISKEYEDMVFDKLKKIIMRK